MFFLNDYLMLIVGVVVVVKCLSLRQISRSLYFEFLQVTIKNGYNY